MWGEEGEGEVVGMMIRQGRMMLNAVTKQRRHMNEMTKRIKYMAGLMTKMERDMAYKVVIMKPQLHHRLL
jgi:hypothetical protein